MRKSVVFIIFLAIYFNAEAQVEKLINPSDLKQQTVVTEPVTLRKGYFRAGMTLSYFALDKYFVSATKKEYYTLSSWHADFTYQFVLRYGITDRLEVDVAIPFTKKKTELHYNTIWPAYDTDMSLSGNYTAHGLADCDLTVKYQIIPQKDNNISLTFWQWITIPTGEKDYSDIKSYTDFKLPLGNGSFTTGSWLNLRKIRYPYSIDVYACYGIKFQGSKRIAHDETEETKFKDGNYIWAGGSFNIHLNEWIVLANDMSYKYNQKGVIKYSPEQITDPAWTFSYSPGLVFQVRRFRITEVVQMPLMGKNNSADPLYVMKVLYTF
jgi:hypothetical protein